MSPEFFFGSPQGDEQEEYEGVGKYLTVYGSGVINTQTAPRKVLEIMYPGQADSFIEQRKLGAPTAVGKAGSQIFNIVSTGYIADGTVRRTVKAIVRKKINKLENVYWNDNTV